MKYEELHSNLSEYVLIRLQLSNVEKMLRIRSIFFLNFSNLTYLMKFWNTIKKDWSNVTKKKFWIEMDVFSFRVQKDKNDLKNVPIK